MGCYAVCYSSTEGTTAGGVTCSPGSGATCCSGRRARPPGPFHSTRARGPFEPVHTARGRRRSAPHTARARHDPSDASLLTPGRRRAGIQLTPSSQWGARAQGLRRLFTPLGFFFETARAWSGPFNASLLPPEKRSTDDMWSTRMNFTALTHQPITTQDSKAEALRLCKWELTRAWLCCAYRLCTESCSNAN